MYLFCLVSEFYEICYLWAWFNSDGRLKLKKIRKQESLSHTFAIQYSYHLSCFAFTHFRGIMLRIMLNIFFFKILFFIFIKNYNCASFCLEMVVNWNFEIEIKYRLAKNLFICKMTLWARGIRDKMIHYHDDARSGEWVLVLWTEQHIISCIIWLKQKMFIFKNRVDKY